MIEGKGRSGARMAGATVVALGLMMALMPPPTADAQGKSDSAPGRSGEAPGRSGEAPGQSGEAPGKAGLDAGGADGSAPAVAKADESRPGSGAAAPEAVLAQSATDKGKGPVTNLPLPRYVSLKGTEGNARRGPSLSHRIDWVFRHAGLPLRVTAEYGQWRRVEDRDGAGGWVHYSLLSGVRTAIIATDMTDLHARAEADSAVTARAEQGAIVRLGACKTDWCQVTGGGTSGWVPKTALWGVDPGEVKD